MRVEREDGMERSKRVLAAGLFAVVLALVGSGCSATSGTAGGGAAQTAPVTASAAEDVMETEGAEDASSESVYRKISAEDAKERMEAGDVVLLDVRTPEEYAQGYIEGAVLLPDFEIASKAETVLPDKNATILLYCRSGNRSAGAAKKLVEMGYANVYDFGGIIDWPYEVVKD